MGDQGGDSIRVSPLAFLGTSGDAGAEEEGAMRTRVERDALGERDVPADAYYGIQTLRAVENFPISGLRAHPAFIVATAQVKLAAAQANMAVGRLEKTIGNGIVSAGGEGMAGRLH